MLIICILHQYVQYSMGRGGGGKPHIQKLGTNYDNLPIKFKGTILWGFDLVYDDDGGDDDINGDSYDDGLATCLTGI